MQVAGVDIGGTTTKVGVLGDKFESVSFSTPHSSDLLIGSIAEAITELSYGEQIAGVGVGCPGAVDLNGEVKFMPNLQIKGFNVAKLLSERLKTKVVVTNDANAAALGECERGGFTDAVMLTLGTGVGSGIVIGGKIYEGPLGSAAELGHMIICADGRKCGCGMSGCLEAYASASALIKRTVEAMNLHKNSFMWELCPDINEVDGKVAFEAEKLSDKAAAEIIAEYVKFLGIGIINICNIFRPQAIIIGGGVSNQGENLLARVREFCKKSHYGYRFAPQPQILKARLGSNAGLYGAIAMIKYKVEENLL
ncbi:MAG: ROK family protein [Clostridiales bacterium]|nr:ROK family protein [Clostridiales bacterium]